MDSMTLKIQEFIRQRGLDTKTVAGDTSISLLKLTSKSGRPLNAEELLRLCSYLNVRPEDIEQLELHQ